jgi:hypothetical protein
MACLYVTKVRIAVRWTVSRSGTMAVSSAETRWLTKQVPSPFSLTTAPNPESDVVIFRALVLFA